MTTFLPALNVTTVVFFVFTNLLTQPTDAQSPIQVQVRQNTLSVDWGGRQRLSGGVPAVNNQMLLAPLTPTRQSATTQTFTLPDGPQPVSVESIVFPKQNVVIFSMKATGQPTPNVDSFTGLFFRALPGYKQGVGIWRYKPWNSWSKPIPLAKVTDMPDWDVQYLYWQYDDGSYGVAMPLSGEGFRTTLGSENGYWGSKAVSKLAGYSAQTVPALAVAFGRDLYEATDHLFATSLTWMGKAGNLRTQKSLPETFRYIGWCTWNASNLGKNLNEGLLLSAAKSFNNNQFPIGWMLIDDGWFQEKDYRLQSLEPNPATFPRGFKVLTDSLKNTYGIRKMGIWHAFDGYWNGIDPASALGREYASELFSWKQPERPNLPDKIREYHFIKPDSDSLGAFYRRWHRYLRGQGFDFVKVDNQLVTERMAVDNYPIEYLAERMHQALNASVSQQFDNTIINCMDMTAEAYLNFGSTAVARTAEDYFPYEPTEGYNLQKGNAASQVLQAIYNSLYFSQMVYPDFDIFESSNPNATFHAIARALNCGPVYITDKVGEQHFEVLRPLVGHDGWVFRSETPLLPTADCLFQVQAPQIFKASSGVRNAGLLGIWNMADADSVAGTFSPGDVRNLAGDTFAVYEHFSNTLRQAHRHDVFPVKLGRLKYQLYYVVPLKNEFAAFGLTEKYNAPATILREQWNQKTVALTLYEGGRFVAYSARKPRQITINGQAIDAFTFANNKLVVSVPTELEKPVIRISW